MDVVKMPELRAHQLVARLVVVCADCKRKYTMRAHNGFSTREPTINNAGDEIRIPIDYPLDEEEEQPAEPSVH